MGSPATELLRNADEGPQVKVKLDGFSIAETEVTWELYELFTDKEKRAALIYSSELVKGNADAVIKPSTPYLDPSYGMGKYSFPATSMTQYAALSFCKWLSELTGEFYRLPRKLNVNMPARPAPIQLIHLAMTLLFWTSMPGVLIIAKINTILLNQKNLIPGVYTICMVM